MSNRTGESNLERPLRAGEIIVFSEENYAGKEWLIKQDTLSLDLYFPVASIRIGPKTGVTIYTDYNYQGTSQELTTDLNSFAKSKLLGNKPKSVKVWSTVGRPFSGFWAIEVAEGRYLSLRRDENGVGVLATSPRVGELEVFRIEETGKTAAGEKIVSFNPREAQFAKSKVTMGSQPLTLDDLQQVTMVEELPSGSYKFSLRDEGGKWLQYRADGDQFLTSAKKTDRNIFCQAFKIAEDETQVGELAQGEVALFENAGFWGKTWIFYKDFAYFDRVTGLDEKVSSIQLGPMTGSTIYRGAKFTPDIDERMGKQDIIYNISALEHEQVGEDQISSIRIWHIIAPGAKGITYQCCLSQDFKREKGLEKGVFKEYSAYRTTLRLAPNVETVYVWTTDKTTIEVGVDENNEAAKYLVDEDTPQKFTPNLVHSLVITIDAVGYSEDLEESRGSLNAPGLKIRTNTMGSDDRIMIYPDREVHSKLAGLTGNELWDATFIDSNGDQQYVIKDRSAQKRKDIEAAAGMVSQVMKTVVYSTDPSGSMEQTILPDVLGGKFWGLDFLRYRVTADTLYVREGPGVSHKPVGYLRKNDVVEYLEYNEDESWIRLRRTADGLTGWSSGKFLDRVPEAPLYQKGERYRVTARGLHVREGPGVEYKSLGYIQSDEVVTAIGINEAGTWRKIVRRDGLIGWSAAKYLTLVPPPTAQAYSLDLMESEETPIVSGMTALTPELSFHEVSQAEVQALLDVSSFPDTNLAQWGLFKKLFKQVKSGVSFVVGQVKQGIALIIKLADEVVTWIVDTVGKIVSFVEGIFEKIGALIEDIIRWIRFLFEWDDIKNVRNFLREAILKSMDYLGTTLAQEAMEQVQGLAGNARDAVDDIFDKACDALGGSSPKNIGAPSLVSNIMSGIESSSAPDAIDWIISKMLSSVGSVGGQVLAFASVGDLDPMDSKDVARLHDFWNGAIDEGLDTAGELSEDVLSVIATFVQDPGNPLQIVTGLIDLCRDQTIGLIEIGEKIVLGLLELVALMMEKIKKILDTEMRIPFISDLLDWLRLGGSLGFSILDAMTLIIAIPVTVIYKATYGEAPPKGIPLAMGTKTALDQYYSCISDVAGVIGTICSLPLDLDLERDPTGAQVTGKVSIFDLLEITTWLASVECWIATWHDYFLKNYEDKRSVEIALFWTETGILMLDVLMALIGKFCQSAAKFKMYTGKIEKFKRGVPATAAISTLIGLAHIVLYIVNGCEDEEQDAEDITFGSFQMLPELYSFLRIPKLSKPPVTETAILIMNSASLAAYLDPKKLKSAV